LLPASHVRLPGHGAVRDVRPGRRRGEAPAAADLDGHAPRPGDRRAVAAARPVAGGQEQLPAGGGVMTTPAKTPASPLAALRTRRYLVLLVLAAIIGAPISAIAYGFLALVTKLQGWIFTDLPKGLGFHAEPLWWPLLPLAVAGVLVALTIQYLPGRGGHSPADGFKAGEGAPSPAELPGVVLAALATLSLGVVLGPEAPLIALGGGLGVLAIRLANRDAPARASAMMAAAGSFAAI